MNNPNTAMGLEKLLIPPEQWKHVVPYDIQRFLNADDGGLVGTGRHPVLGWFVIESFGQGPDLIWHEAKGYEALKALTQK